MPSQCIYIHQDADAMYHEQCCSAQHTFHKDVNYFVFKELGNPFLEKGQDLMPVDIMVENN